MSTTLPCPSCGHARTAVLESRAMAPAAIYRRRRCLACDHRFSTHERYATDMALADELRAAAAMIQKASRAFQRKPKVKRKAIDPTWCRACDAPYHPDCTEPKCKGRKS